MPRVPEPERPRDASRVAMRARRLEVFGWAALAGIFAFGTLLRLLGVSFGLPYHHHWDEAWITDSVVGMLRRHDSVPASYQYGAPLMRLTELVFVAGRWLRPAGSDVTGADAQTTVYLSARIVTALISSTGTVATYLAARHGPRRDGDPAAIGRALAAALLYAVASELVLHSRYAVTDACLVALTAWTLAFTSIYLERRSIAWGAAATLAAGVTCAFKAPGFMTTLVPALATLTLFVQARRLGQAQRTYGWLLAATVPVVLLTYVALNPHVVDRSGDAMRDIIGRYRQVRDGGVSSCYLRTPGLPHLAAAVVAIVTQFPSRSVLVSVAVSAVSLAGIADGLRRRDATTAVAAAYGACLVLSVALPNRSFLFRNYLVVVPVIALGFGNGVVSLVATLRARLAAHGALGPIALAALGLAAAAALVGRPLFEAIRAQRLHDDARVRALAWVAGQSSAEAPAEVGVTPSVFGKLAMGGHGEIRALLRRPEVHIAADDLQACPDPSSGPQYLLGASYRDTHHAPSSDPWQELWLFKDCPGYDTLATFDASPYEVNVPAYPTWPGRVSAIVLRRSH